MLLVKMVETCVSSNSKKPLTYFHPRVVLQHSQNMSATACRPVNKTLSSAGPQPTLTLKNNHTLMFIMKEKLRQP